VIPVKRVDEPPEFEQRTRAPGQAWLQAKDYLHRSGPQDYWSWCAEPLREAFHERCGWLAMYIADGHVEHFVSWNECKHVEPQLAYEWSNYRYILPRLNSRKQHRPSLLDPFDVGPGWFRVELPSLLLVCTEVIPEAVRVRAQATIDHLGLVGRGDDRIRGLRRRWLQRYRDGHLSLAGLSAVAPVVADAVAALLSTAPEALTPELVAYRDELVRERSAAGGSIP
jgi:hypothetical protein